MDGRRVRRDEAVQHLQRRVDRVERRDAGHVIFDRGAPEQKAEAVRDLAPRRRVDHERDPVFDDVADDMVPMQEFHGNSRSRERRVRVLGGAQRVPPSGQRARDLRAFALVAVRDGQQHPTRRRNRQAGREKRLVERGAVIPVNAHDLARRFHLRTQEGVDVRHLGEREDRRLDDDELRVRG